MRKALFRGPRPTRRWVRLVRGVAGLVAAIALVWLGGYLWFTGIVPREGGEETRITDAIVVLTGGVGRLDAGLALLAERRAKKLFISGVGAGTTRAEMRRRAADYLDQFECCVVLGRDAADTEGNAAETAQWMAAEGYRSLRLVTASYHMPRSIVEFRRAMPEAEVAANPVFSEHVKLDHWWAWPGTALLFADEFNKYLISLTRARLVGPLPQPADS